MAKFVDSGVEVVDRALVLLLQLLVNVLFFLNKI
jgi:hypothetical protein